MVIQTGKETRSAMNTSDPRIKEGRTDVQMNMFVKGLFLFLCAVALAFCLLSSDAGILTFLRFFVLYNNIIPLSLKVCMDVGKLLISYGIAHDPKMQRIQVNSTSIPEQLGKINHVFSDKTGTLTKNVMRVLKVVYGESQVCDGPREVQKRLHNEEHPGQPQVSESAENSFHQAQPAP